MFTQLNLTGNNNIILTDIHGSSVTLSVTELLAQYFTQLEDILKLIQQHSEPNYIALAEVIKNYKENHVISDLDAYNQYLAKTVANQTATTSQPIVGKGAEELDKKEVKRLLALPLVKDHFVKHKIAKNAPLAQKLRALTLMTNGYVVKGTFFCLAHVSNLSVFGGNVAFCSFAVFDTLDKTYIRKNEQVYGNLVQQYQNMEELVTNALSPMEIIEWNPRKLDYSIPKDVFRELLANAFVHRSYESDAQYRIMVELYPDRMVIKNAGSFPPTINPSDLTTIESVTRNQEISRIFFLHGFIELQGTGIARVQQILSAQGLPPAIFKQENNLVTVTVYKREMPIHLNEKARNAYNIGDYPTALGYYQKALQLQEKILSPEHLDLATSYNNIALTYYNIKDYATAYSYIQKAVAIYIKALPEGHLHIQNVLNTKAKIEKAMRGE